MRIFLFIYTLAMVAGSVISLALTPGSLRDLGRERERLKEALPDVSYDEMVAAGYRFNTLVLLLEIVYYYLLLSYSGDDRRLFAGASAFGVIHIVYLVASRFEKRRLARDYTRSRGAALTIRLTALLTILETVFLVLVLYLLVDTSA